MIDISDGLATDLSHLAKASHVGCDLAVEQIPISAAASELDDGRSPLQHALYDGEDFELLFTIPAPRREAFATAWPQAFDLPCTEIGRVTADNGEIRCVRPDGSVVPLEGAGYSHF